MSEAAPEKLQITCQQRGCKNVVEGVKKTKRTCFDCKTKRRNAHAAATWRAKHPKK